MDWYFNTPKTSTSKKQRKIKQYSPDNSYTSVEKHETPKWKGVSHITQPPSTIPLSQLILASPTPHPHPHTLTKHQCTLNSFIIILFLTLVIRCTLGAWCAPGYGTGAHLGPLMPHPTRPQTGTP